MTPQMKSLQDVRKLASGELSLAARLGYVALLLGSSSMMTVIAALWLTEAALPLRTQLAFGAMCVIGLSWAGLAVWALRVRRPLFARDRVIAGRMAVAFTTVFLCGAIVAVILVGNAASLGALGSGLAMLALAVRAWSDGRRRFAELTSRRAALE